MMKMISIAALTIGLATSAFAAGGINSNAATQPGSPDYNSGANGAMTTDTTTTGSITTNDIGSTGNAASDAAHNCNAGATAADNNMNASTHDASKTNSSAQTGVCH